MQAEYDFYCTSFLAEMQQFDEGILLLRAKESLNQARRYLIAKKAAVDCCVFAPNITPEMKKSRGLADQQQLEFEDNLLKLKRKYPWS
jgi:hypothetical protein